jgi:prepilin-type N-terminal cleavage/methylation domain-containing protein
MQVTSKQQNSKPKRHDFVELSRYLNKSKGFTLVELLISIGLGSEQNSFITGQVITAAGGE